MLMNLTMTEKAGVLKTAYQMNYNKICLTILAVNQNIKKGKVG